MKVASWALLLLGIGQGIVIASKTGRARASKPIKPNKDAGEIHTHLQACKDTRKKLNDFYSYYGSGASEFRLKDGVIEILGKHVDNLELAVDIFIKSPNIIFEAGHSPVAAWGPLPSLSQPAKDLFNMLLLKPTQPADMTHSVLLKDNPSAVYWRFRRFEVKFDHIRRLAGRTGQLFINSAALFNYGNIKKVYADHVKLARNTGTVEMHLRYLSEVTSRIMGMNKRRTLERLYEIVQDVLKEITLLLPVVFEGDIHTVLAVAYNIQACWRRVDAFVTVSRAEFLTGLLDSEKTPDNVKLAIWRYYNKFTAQGYFLNITHFREGMEKAPLSCSTAPVLITEMQNFIRRQLLKPSLPSLTSTPGDSETLPEFIDSLDDATSEILLLTTNSVSTPNTPKVRKIEWFLSEDEEFSDQMMDLKLGLHNGMLIVNHSTKSEPGSVVMIVSDLEEPKDLPASSATLLQFDKILKKFHRHLLHYSTRAKTVLSQILAEDDESKREQQLSMVLPKIVDFLVAGRKLELIHGSALPKLTICTPDIGISHVADGSRPPTSSIEKRKVSLETPC